MFCNTTIKEEPVDDDFTPVGGQAVVCNTTETQYCPSDGVWNNQQLIGSSGYNVTQEAINEANEFLVKGEPLSFNEDCASTSAVYDTTIGEAETDYKFDVTAQNQCGNQSSNSRC